MMQVLQKIGEVLAATRRAGQEVSSNLDGIRRQIIELADERARIENAKVPKSVALARMEQVFARIDERGAMTRHDIASLITDRRGAPGFDVFGSHGFDTGAQNRLLWLLDDVVRQRILEKIEECYGEEDGISDEARAARLAENDKQRLDLELVEEAMVRAAEAAGIEILRRADADPRAVLADNSEMPK